MRWIVVIILFGVWWKASNNERPLVAGTALVLITAILVFSIFDMWM